LDTKLKVIYGKRVVEMHFGKEMCSDKSTAAKVLGSSSVAKISVLKSQFLGECRVLENLTML
jgi:hypothetical protein